tara:strand:+ start:20649 stop:21341 length:693 start_codon:yes stop_codon:yes gene_type:complete
MTESVNDMKSKKYIYALLFLTLIIIAYLYNSYLESMIIENIVFLEEYYSKNPTFFIIIFFFIYILFTTLSLPVALFLGLLSGFIFELYVAVVVVSFASTLGATSAMLVSRYFIRDYIQKKFTKQAMIVDRELTKYGTYYLFALRMSPIFPFFVINVVFGLTNIKVLAFYIISQLGMLPATYVIISIGSELNKTMIHGASLSKELIIYLTILGILPLIFKKYTKKDLHDHQ